MHTPEYADELKEYPNIELRWREVGLSFQVNFVKRDFIPTQKENVGINSELLLLVRENNRISAKELAETMVLILVNAS